METKTNNKPKLHVRKGDTIMVIAGNAKGKSGVITEMLTKKSRVLVEGVNLQTKHVKPNAQNPQGGIEKRNRNLIKKNKKEIKKIIQNEDLLSSSTDEEEEIIVKKSKKKTPKHKIIYIETDTEEEVEVKKHDKYDVKTPTFKKEPPRRIIQFL